MAPRQDPASKTQERELSDPDSLRLKSIFAFASAILLRPEPFETIVPKWELRYTQPFVCKGAPYIVRTISCDPLIQHLENFISPAERKWLLSKSKNLSQPSEVRRKIGEWITSPHKTSTTAYFPKDDPVARCISERAAQFQGYESIDDVDRLQVTSYVSTQEVKAHYDWYGALEKVEPHDCKTTFFGILDADCEDCGTNFPKIKMTWARQDRKWCRLVDCDSSSLTVLPTPGSAVFWRNLHTNGSGYVRTLHAGMPWSRGEKVGLNIWTKQRFDVGLS
ncbi:uncharacterized protein CLAFUR5_12308 [Fulvia fulva]|uniref:Prolyl 4-hydroxylase alpha subunit domain-containing protein n=1 Tax=Passalora fulva TaxID=5499 RepID=A0A9Q8PIF2_PASFU|nr:uncharacterized protein CLAFUR5_12308 [Fulvia fulva]KAK4616796.1 hypothetical protein CLAFUR0_09934 [Fulvia fulva]UJO23053.1 hypothetical protein CLAFUR5_12308 [Fulvia fulva]